MHFSAERKFPTSTVQFVNLPSEGASTASNCCAIVQRLCHARRLRNWLARHDLLPVEGVSEWSSSDQEFTGYQHIIEAHLLFAHLYLNITMYQEAILNYLEHERQRCLPSCTSCAHINVDVSANVDQS